MENLQEKNANFFRFEGLRIYGKAVDYSAWLIKTLTDPQKETERNLYNSFCHSAYDIALNIAEGSSRTKSQFDHYLKISKTAIRECVVYTAIAEGVGLLNDEQVETSRELLMELTRMIGALIISLQKGASRKREEDILDSVDTDFNTEFSDLN